MISTSEANALIHQHISPLPPGQFPLGAAAGLTLAADLSAPADIPAFPQSSMDGYAFSFGDWKRFDELAIDGMIPAGQETVAALLPQQAARIFTGAAVPPGADTVVMQEKTQSVNGRLRIEDEHLQRGGNVRPQGSEIRKGELALPAGSRLTPAALGFLAGIGIATVPAHPRPRVALIVTGNELQTPGKPLSFGQVYESNSVALQAALQQLGHTPAATYKVKDDPEALQDILQAALQESDLVLLTGGVSVGAYDFVLPAAGRCGVHTVFHKVKQRPGKPLFFGLQGQKPVFGLPGNPSSVLTCFYRYVWLALDRLGNTSAQGHSIQAPLAKDYTKAAGLTHFLKGYYDGQSADPLDAQESYRMRSFARANCLIQIDEEQTRCEKGTPVTVHLLPH
ncbi:MAG TPA: gephyrin-like molybdotransferase Glp [Chitinophagaceae bacterium]|jgi:molybdopterin molybdotransferase|nr:gephyrin-like molybdotransferase Glp [Chitinophagaceae bacterium]